MSLRVLCLLSVWVAATWGNSRRQQFRTLCPPDSLVVAASGPLEEHVVVMSALECGANCLEQAACRAYQVIGPAEDGSSTCQLFHCDAYSCGEAGTGQKVRSYKAMPAACPPAFVYEFSTCSCYYVDTEARSVRDAAYAACRQYGAHLLAINSAHEQSVVEAILAAYGDTCTGYVWTGGESSDPLTRSSWKWNLTDTLVPMDYQNWDSGQPQGGSQFFMILKAPAAYKWHDARMIQGTDCSVCEYEV